MTARLQYSKAHFDNNVDDVQTNYIKACANAAGDGVSVADVVIKGTTAQLVRRRLLADAVDVDTEIRVASAVSPPGGRCARLGRLWACSRVADACLGAGGGREPGVVAHC